MFVRIILTLLLIYASYGETGAFTATSFLLIFLYIELQGRLTKRALDLPHGGLLCEVVVDEEGGTKIYPIESANQ